MENIPRRVSPEEVRQAVTDLREITNFMSNQGPMDTIEALVAYVEMLENTIKVDDERLVKAAEVAGMTPIGCDTPMALAEKVVELRENVQQMEKEQYWLAKTLMEAGYVSTVAMEKRPEYRGMSDREAIIVTWIQAAREATNE